MFTSEFTAFCKNVLKFPVWTLKCSEILTRAKSRQSIRGSNLHLTSCVVPNLRLWHYKGCGQAKLVELWGKNEPYKWEPYRELSFRIGGLNANFLWVSLWSKGLSGSFAHSLETYITVRQHLIKQSAQPGSFNSSGWANTIIKLTQLNCVWTAKSVWSALTERPEGPSALVWEEALIEKGMLGVPQGCVLGPLTHSCRVVQHESADLCVSACVCKCLFDFLFIFITKFAIILLTVQHCVCNGRNSFRIF